MTSGLIYSNRMIISRIFRRTICNTSLPIRIKPSDTSSCKRLFFKEKENFLDKKNVRKFRTYEGDGKTVGFIINKKGSEVLLISTVMTHGFVLANGMELVGPIIIFPHSLISWNVTTARDVNEKSLVLFKLLEPKIDILIFGFGCPADYTPEVKETFTKACKKLGIRFEALPTEHAVGTYNFLADERRLVAGAFIPPTSIDSLRFDRSLSVLDEIEDEDEEEVPAIGGGAPLKLIK